MYIVHACPIEKFAYYQKDNACPIEKSDYYQKDNEAYSVGKTVMANNNYGSKSVTSVDEDNNYAWLEYVMKCIFRNKLANNYSNVRLSNQFI